MIKGLDKPFYFCKLILYTLFDLKKNPECYEFERNMYKHNILPICSKSKPNKSRLFLKTLLQFKCSLRIENLRAIERRQNNFVTKKVFRSSE